MPRPWAAKGKVFLTYFWWSLKGYFEACWRPFTKPFNGSLRAAEKPKGFKRTSKGFRKAFLNSLIWRPWRLRRWLGGSRVQLGPTSYAGHRSHWDVNFAGGTLELSGSPRKSQKEGQEDQRWIKELGGPPSCFEVLWSSWLSCWLFLGLPDNPLSHLIARPASYKISWAQGWTYRAYMESSGTQCQSEDEVKKRKIFFLTNPKARTMHGWAQSVTHSWWRMLHGHGLASFIRPLKILKAFERPSKGL